MRDDCLAFSLPFKSRFLNCGNICAIKLSREFAIEQSANPCTKFEPTFKAKNTFPVVDDREKFT